MVYTYSNLRQIRRRTNKRKIIKGYGLLDYIRKKGRSLKSWAQRKIPQVFEGLKRVGKRHWEELKEGGIPLNKEQLYSRARSLGNDLVTSARRSLTGSGYRKNRFNPFKRRKLM